MWRIMSLLSDIKGGLVQTSRLSTGWATGFTTGWMFVCTMQPVVLTVVQPVWVWEPVVSCKLGISLLWWTSMTVRCIARHVMALHCEELRALQNYGDLFDPRWPIEPFPAVNYKLHCKSCRAADVGVINAVAITSRSPSPSLSISLSLSLSLCWSSLGGFCLAALCAGV